MRVILEAVIAVLVITVLRSVIGIILKGASDLFNSSSETSGRGASPRSKPIPTADELKKDPVCGTFIAASTSVQKTIAGETYYFCSPQCRDKFSEAVRKA